MPLYVVTALRPLALPLPLDDDAFLARLRSDDETAFTELYRRHARYIAGVVYKLLGDDQDLDDVVQETFIDAEAGVADIQEPAAIKRWLVVIAIRRVHRLLARRRLRRFYTWKLSEVAPQSSDPREGRPAYELYDALDKLPPPLRIAWILFRVGAMPLPEIAASCEISVATVKRRIGEADERLKRKLAE